MRVFFVVAFALLAACATAPQPKVVRQMGGSRWAGPYVPPASYASYIRAELLFARGDYQSAAAAFRRTMEEGTQDAFVLSRLAECWLRMGKVAEARKVVNRGLRSAPRSEALWLVSARIAEEEDEPNAAIAAYTRAQHAAPLAAEAPLGLAAFLRRQGAEQRADAVLQQYLERTSSSSLAAARVRLQTAIANRDRDAAARAADAFLDIAPARAEEVREAARYAMANAAPAVAAVLLNHVSREPQEEVLRIRALLAAGQRRQAAAILEHSSPDRFGGVLPMARLYLALERPERAVELAEVGLAGRSRSSEAYHVRGLARLAQRDWIGAATDFARVPVGARDFVAARLKLAALLESHGLSDAAGAVLQVALIQSGGGSRALRRALAEWSLHHQGLTSALQHFEQVPTSWHQAQRARLLELGGDFNAAQNTYASIENVALSALPAGARARVQAERLWQRGRRKQAVKILKRRIGEAPEDLRARVRLADMLMQIDQVHAAQTLATQTLPLVTNTNLKQQLTALLQTTQTTP